MQINLEQSRTQEPWNIWSFLWQDKGQKPLTIVARGSISDVVVEVFTEPSLTINNHGRWTFAACLVMNPSVMTNLLVTNLISLWFVLQVLNTLMCIYDKAFTPFQANVPIFLPPEHLRLCDFREYKIGILARDGLTLDGISDTARS